MATTDQRRARAQRTAAWLLRLLSPLAPSERRREWHDEWHAELWHRSRSIDGSRTGMLAFYWTALSCVPHALFLRSRFWTVDAVTVDCRQALRGLRRRWRLTAGIVATLALALGALGTVVGAVYGVLLRPLPFHEPSRIVRVAENNLSRGWSYFPVRYRNFEAWQSTTAFAAIAAADWEYFALTDHVEPERLSGMRVTCAYFDVMGVAPVLGRRLEAPDCEPGAERVVVLGHGIWTRLFGGDRAVVGRVVRLDGVGHTVIGVMAPAWDYEWIGWKDLWVPLQLSPADARADLRHLYFVHGRLTPGVTFEQAEVELQTTVARLAADHPDTNTGWGVTVRRLHDYVVEPVRQSLLVFLGAVALVLLVAVANVANLLLAQSIARRREVATQLALGAPRSRLARQCLLEGVLLATTSAGLGLLIAQPVLRALVALETGDVPRLAEAVIDPAVVALVGVVSVLLGLVLGLVPAVQAGVDPSHVLQLDSRGALGDPRSGRFRRLLAMAQIAMCLTLLVGAGVLGRRFVQLVTADPGFTVGGVLVAEVDLPEGRLDSEQERAFAWNDVLSRVASTPGVTGATLAYAAPPGVLAEGEIRIEGRPAPAPGQELDASWTKVGPGYFRLLGIPLLRGREFGDPEVWTRHDLAVVTETLVRRYFPDEEVIGRRLTFDDPASDDARWVTVVGIAPDLPDPEGEGPIRPAVYLPVSYRTAASMLVVAQSDAQPAAFVPSIRAAIRGVAGDISVPRIRPLTEWMAETRSRPRFSAVLFSGFAALGLTLAFVGLYAVLSFSLTERRREIAVRLALGARPSDVTALVSRDGLGLLAWGSGVGLAGAFALRAALGSAIPGLDGADPVVFIVALGVLVLAGVAAIFLPARRAGQVEPMQVLRQS